VRSLQKESEGGYEKHIQVDFGFLNFYFYYRLYQQ